MSKLLGENQNEGVNMSPTYVRGKTERTLVDAKAPLQNVKRSIYLIMENISERISGLEGSAFYQPLLFVLVGVWIILDGFKLLLSIFQVNIEALVLFTVRKILASQQARLEIWLI